MKTCSKCNQPKPLSGYHFRKERSQYYAHCKDCHRAMSRKWHNDNPEESKKQRAAYYEKQKTESPDTLVSYRLWHQHGITLDDFLELLRSQGGVCAICGSDDPLMGGGRDARFVVEHDHSCCPGQRSCGKCIRGLTCHPCNRLLGQAKDNPDTLIKAAAYLLSYEFTKQ